MMEEFEPGDKRATVNHHIQRKRPNSILRDCGEGSSVANLDEYEYKKIKGVVSCEPIQNLTKRKTSASYPNDKPYTRKPRMQYRMGFVGRGAIARQRYDDRVNDKVRSSAILLNLLSSGDDGDDDDDEVVRDGPGEGKKAKQQSKASNYSPQLTDRVTHTRPMPFTHSTEPPEGRHAHRDVARCQSCNAQDWEGSNDEHYHRDGCVMASKQLYTAQPERSLTQSNTQSNSQDGNSQCFKSPTQSQSGSPNTAQSSELLTFRDSQQETECSTSFPATLCYPVRLGGSRFYYRVDGRMQWITSDSISLTRRSNAAVLRQDPLSSSSQASGDHLSEVSVHSHKTELRSNYTRMHSADVMEARTHLRQNQLLPTSNLTLPSSGQHQSVTSQGTKTSEGAGESFYPGESHHKADYQLQVFPKTRSTDTYESISEVQDNQYVPYLS